MNEKPRSPWRKTKRFFLGLAYLAVLIAVFYAEEDWRGWYAWHRFKHHWEAKGERFDPASIIPPAVPEDQNFAMTPIVASCYLGMVDKNGRQLRPPDTNVVDRLKMTIAHDNDSPANGTGPAEVNVMGKLEAETSFGEVTVT